MQMTGEILNLVWPGTGTIPSIDNLKLRKCSEAGRAIVKMTIEDRKPSVLMTRGDLHERYRIRHGHCRIDEYRITPIAIANELGIKITFRRL